MDIFYSFTLGLWSLALLFAWLIWLRLPVVLPRPKLVSFAVLIPVRNEAINLPGLLHDLANQSYLPNEVWILDDGSTDGTEALIQSYQSSFPTALHYWKSNRPENSPHSPKKYAFSALIQQITTDWIVTTDGDCRVGPHWLATLAGQTTDRVFLAGPISFLPKPNFWVGAQIIELASLQLTAAVTAHLHRPTLCSAANMAFERATFPGYADNWHIASGDDEFLLHAYQQKFPGKIGWVKSPKALVLTHALTTWKSFFDQRKRWASKWNRYTNWFPRFLAIFVFLVNLATLLALFSGEWIWLGLRWGIEFGLLATYLTFFDQQKWIGAIPGVQVLYAPYAVFFGLIAQRKTTYEWKGRTWE